MEEGTSRPQSHGGDGRQFPLAICTDVGGVQVGGTAQPHPPTSTPDAPKLWLTFSGRDTGEIFFFAYGVITLQAPRKRGQCTAHVFL